MSSAWPGKKNPRSEWLERQGWSPRSVTTGMLWSRFLQVQYDSSGQEGIERKSQEEVKSQRQRGRGMLAVRRRALTGRLPRAEISNSLSKLVIAEICSPFWLELS